MTPAQYYIYLVNSGMPREQAMSTVQQHYGPMRNQQQQQQDAQSQQTLQTIGAAAGMIGGYLLTDYIKDNAGSWWNKVTGKKVTEETAKQLNSASGQFAESGTLGISRAAPPPTTQVDGSGAEVNLDAGASATPEVVSVKGDTATIKTPDGGTQNVPKEALNDSEFWSNVNWGQVVQGGLALAQMYGAYQSWKKGDKVGGGINMAAGAGNLAASGALGAETAGAASSAAGGYLIPGLNIAAGVYGGYQTAQAMGDMAAGSQRSRTGAIGGAASGAAIGAGLGSILPGPGTAIGAVIGAAVGGTAGLIGSWTGSHKGKAQFMRDNIRGVLQQNNILDSDYKGTLADGSKYDFGKDGSTLKWKEIDKVAAANPNSWSKAVSLGDALAASYGFVGQKASDISAWYAKGAVSNAKDDPNIAMKNMQHFAQQQGITFDLVKSKLDQAIADNRISQTQYDAYLNGAKELTAGVKPPAPASTPVPKAPVPNTKQSLRTTLNNKMGE